MFIYRLYYLTCFRNSRPSLPTQAGYQEWKARFANQILRGGTTGGRSWWKINKRKVGEEGRVFQKISFSRCLVVAVWTKVKRRMKVSRFPATLVYASRNILEDVVGPNEKLVAWANTLVDSWQTARWTSGELSIGTVDEWEWRLVLRGMERNRGTECYEINLRIELRKWTMIDIFLKILKFHSISLYLNVNF